jgi:hypothetical protein
MDIRVNGSDAKSYILDPCMCPFLHQVRSQSVNTHLSNVAQEFIYDKDEHIFVTKM